MNDSPKLATSSSGWRSWGGAVFAAVWGALAALLVPGPERGFMEEAAEYSGKLFGAGVVYGLIAAAIAHVLILRGQSRSAKVTTYLAGALVGGFTAMLVNG